MTCDHCGDALPENSGNRRRFCNGSCRTLSYRLRKRRAAQAAHRDHWTRVKAAAEAKALDLLPEKRSL